MIDFNEFTIDELKEMVWNIDAIIDKKEEIEEMKKDEVCKKMINDTDFEIEYMGYKHTFVEWLKAMIEQKMVIIDIDDCACDGCIANDVECVDYDMNGEDIDTFNRILIRE